MTLRMELSKNSYDITVEAGVLDRLASLFSLDRKVLIVTDTNIPADYVQRACAACKTPVVVTLPAGEGTKCFASLETLCRRMLEEGFTRADAVLALGGGVIGDLAGFASAIFMRGIDFYNVPTTLLSQVDSSIGGKTAVDLDGTKNIVGAFHQPKGVAVDPALLSTLPPRQIANGLAEAIKMSATCDKALFEAMEEAEDLTAMLPEIILGSLKIKKNVVEQDETEKGLRRVLNFGHTLGHGIEAVKGDLYHGECVGLGMLWMCSDAVRPRLERLLKKAGLPTECQVSLDRVLKEVAHDKKTESDCIHTVYVRKIGSFELNKDPLADFISTIRERAKQ